MEPTRNTVLVELHVPDFEEIKGYYGKLGFEVVRETKPTGKDVYHVLKLEDNILCCWAGNEEVYEHSCFKRFPRDTKRGYGVEIVLMVADVESYYQKVKAFTEVISPLSPRPWGLQDFRIVVPFRY